MNENPASHIALEQLFFTRSVVLSIHDYQPDDDAAVQSPENTVSVSQISESPRRYQIVMRSQLNPAGTKNCPYVLDMECVATLTADDVISPEDASRGAAIIGHNVAYGAIREAVSWITGRHPFGSLTLGLSILRPALDVPPTE